MPSSSYFIYKCVGDDGADPAYWNDTIHQWDSEFNNATPFPRVILTAPMPSGATHVLEMASTGEPVQTFAIVAQ